MSAQMAATHPASEGNAGALYVLSTDERECFEQWMDDLDAEHARRGAPYGDGSLRELTGAVCWLDYFLLNYEPHEALNEDAAHFDE